MKLKGWLARLVLNALCNQINAVLSGKEAGS